MVGWLVTLRQCGLDGPQQILNKSLDVYVYMCINIYVYTYVRLRQAEVRPSKIADSPHATPPS